MATPTTTRAGEPHRRHTRRRTALLAAAGVIAFSAILAGLAPAAHATPEQPGDTGPTNSSCPDGIVLPEGYTWCQNGIVPLDSDGNPIGLTPDPADDPAAGGPPAWFPAAAILIVVLSIAGLVLRVHLTRKWATAAGMSDTAATNLALFGGDAAPVAAYAAKAVAEAAEQPELSIEERIARVRALETNGTLTAEQAAEQISRIIADR